MVALRIRQDVVIVGVHALDGGKRLLVVEGRRRLLMLGGQVLMAEPRDLASSLCKLDFGVLLMCNIPSLARLAPGPPPRPTPLKARLLLEAGDS